MNPRLRNSRLSGIAWERHNELLSMYGIIVHYYSALLSPGLKVSSLTDWENGAKTTICKSDGTLVGIGYNPQALGRITQLEPPPKTCPLCHGMGEVSKSTLAGDTLTVPIFAALEGNYSSTERCERCDGKGWVNEGRKEGDGERRG